MSMNARIQKRSFLLTVATVIGVSVLFAMSPVNAAQQEGATPYSSPQVQRFEVDISENPSRFIFDETPITQDPAGNPVPGDGNEFKTEGYIYERGTLTGDGDGVNADGSPQFPEKVIGRWYCWGYHVGNGGATETGPWVITHQLFDFGKRHGRHSIVTAGLELVDLNVPLQRAISGGTGRFKNARGEAVQAMVGFNVANGVNLRVRFKVSNPN